jgi:hypothetical protein
MNVDVVVHILKGKGVLEKYVESTCEVLVKCSRARASEMFPGGPIALPRNTLNTNQATAERL